MKRIITVLMLVFSVVVVMSSCGEKNKTNDEETDLEQVFEIIEDDLDEIQEETLNVSEESTDDNLVPIDVFGGMQLIYTGANGFGSVRFENYYRDVEFSVGDFYFKPASYEPYELRTYDVLKVIYNNKELCNIGYDIIDMVDLDDTLSKGDTIKLKVKTVPENAFEDLGFKPTYYKEVKVPDLGEYVTKTEQITSDIINKLFNSESVMKEIADRGEVVFNDAYLIKANPGIEIRGNCPYSIVMVYSDDNNKWSRICKIDDVVIKNDGSVQQCGETYIHVMREDFFSGGAVTNFSSAEEACFEIENNFDSQFTVEKIDL